MTGRWKQNGVHHIIIDDIQSQNSGIYGGRSRHLERRFDIILPFCRWRYHREGYKECSEQISILFNGSCLFGISKRRTTIENILFPTYHFMKASNMKLKEQNVDIIITSKSVSEKLEDAQER